MILIVGVQRVGRPGFLSLLGFRLPLLGDAPGLGQGPPGLLQQLQLSLHPGQGVPVRQIAVQLLQGCQLLAAAGQVLLGLPPLPQGLLLFQGLPLGSALLQLLYPGLGGALLFPGVFQLGGKLRLAAQGLVQPGLLLLQLRDQAGFVVAAAVQLFFQPIIAFGIGYILLTCGQQGGDAAFQLRVLGHGQSALPDEGAALEYLPGDAQQGLAQVLTGDIGHRLGGAGIGAGEVTHGGADAAGAAQDGPQLTAGVQVHAALHGFARPGGIAVLVCQGTALTGGQAIQHGAQKAAPGGLAGFVGGADHVEPRLQPECVAPQPPIGGLHIENAQEESPPLYKVIS